MQAKESFFLKKLVSKGIAAISAIISMSTNTNSAWSKVIPHHLIKKPAEAGS
jgi:hypothetical protein